MATQIHGAGPSGQRSPGLDLAIAGYLTDNPPAGGGASALNDLTDVDTTGATTGQVLTFDGSEWSPDAPSAGTVTSTSISDSTATGRAVLTAADAATARSAIGAGTSNLAIGTTGSTAAAGNRAASTTAIGMVELATNTEATTGTDTTRAVTPAGVKAVVDALSIPDSPDDIGAAPAAAGVPSGGTTGQVLTKTSGTDYAAAWETPAGGGGGGGLTLLASASPENAAHTFSGIPGTYAALRLLIVKHQGTGGGGTVAVTFNGDTEDNYATNGNAGEQTAIRAVMGQAQTSQWILDVVGYANTAHHKVAAGVVAGGINAGNDNFGASASGGRWASTDAITSITVTPYNSEQGVMDLYLYGVSSS